jgi:hypothetical protein
MDAGYGPIRGYFGLHAMDGMSLSAPTSRQSMRSFLAALEQAGEVTALGKP